MNLRSKAIIQKNNLPDTINDTAHVLNLDGYKLIGTHWIALYVNGNNPT